MGQRGNWKYFFGGVLAAGLAVAIGFAALIWALDLNLGKAVQMARFLATMRYVETQYVEEVDTAKLMDGAITGMGEILG